MGDASTNDTPSGDGGNMWTLVGVDGGATNGSVVMNPDGTYTYTPDPDFNGMDTITYMVCDTNGDCSTAEIIITITPVNDVPVAVDDTNTTNEDTPVMGNASTNDTPSGDGGNTWSLVGVDGGATNGSVVMNPDGTYTYTPDPDFNGMDTITYTVCDTNADCDTAIIVITITPVNDVPVAVDDTNTTMEDTPVSGDASTNDTASGDGGNTWTLVGVDGGATNGSVVMNPDGTYTYTPDPDFNGMDTITYMVCDTNGDCSTAEIIITITPVNDAPVAVDDTNTTNEDTPVMGDASTNDTPSGDGGNMWTLVGVDGAATNGSVVMNPDGTYTYTPDPDFNGMDTITYMVCDTNGDCSTAEIIITITPVNDVPVAVDDTNTTNEDTPVMGDASTNDTPSGDGGNTWSLVGVDGGAMHGSVVMNPDGTYTYTPETNFNGMDTITYMVCDTNGDCSTAIIIITVTPDEFAAAVTCAVQISPIDCPAAPVFTPPTVTEFCDPFILTFTDVTTPGICEGTYSVTRTWTATDDCLNIATCSATIMVQDTTPPTITCATQVTPIACPALPVFVAPTATDACDPTVVVTFSDVTTPGTCTGAYSVTRTWTATDDCGNTATCSGTIVVQDITPPTITCATQVTPIACPALPVFVAPTATDACDPTVAVTFSDVTTPGTCTGAYSVTRTWTATDDCGNTATCSGTIVVQDITPPTITCAL